MGKLRARERVIEQELGFPGAAGSPLSHQSQQTAAADLAHPWASDVCDVPYASAAWL